MRKQRTRQHQIEDLGFNYIERHILNANYVVHRYARNDYGNDGLINFFNENGEFINGKVNFQLKSTDHIERSAQQGAFNFDLSVRDLEYWLMETDMMLLMLYDAQNEMAYYIDIQAYFKENGIKIKKGAKFQCLRLYRNIHYLSIYSCKLLLFKLLLALYLLY